MKRKVLSPPVSSPRSTAIRAAVRKVLNDSKRSKRAKTAAGKDISQS